VQGLRALAVLMVVAFHVGGSPVGGTRADSPLGTFLKAGFVGVDVFFVVSGFVITAMLVRERERTGRTSFRDFYARRARRLLPALAFMTVIVLILSVLVLSPFGPQQFAMRTAVAANAFVANVYLYLHTGYFDATAAQNPFLHTWSLSVEEQTYLVLPVGLASAAWVGARLRRSGRAAMAVAVALVSAASLALMLALSGGWRPGGAEAPVRLAFLGTPARLWEFGAGALLALGWRHVERLPRAAAEALGVAGLVALVVVAIGLDPGLAFPGPVTVVVVLATVALLAAGTHPTLVTRGLSVRPAVWMGDRSYSWYLWHWPLIVLAVVVWPHSWVAPLLAGIVSLLPAWAAHRWIEQPVRLDQRVMGWRAVRLAGVSVGGVALAALVVSFGASKGWGLGEADGWYDLPNGRNVGCHVFNRDNDMYYPGEVCATRPPGVEAGRWLVLGDLTADSAAPAVVAAANRLGYGTVQWTRSGCPFLTRAPVHSPSCAEWQRRAWQLVDTVEPAMVVVSADSAAYTTAASPEEVIARPDGSHPSSDADAVRQWSDALRDTVGELRRRGIPVMVIGAPPAFEGDFPRDHLSLLTPRPDLPAPLRDQAAARRDQVWSAEQQVLVGPGVALVDPFDKLCDQVDGPDRRCPVWVDGTWRYYDDRHLTNAGSLLLTDQVASAASQLLDQQ
jgi:peptidoglycan/LPS O-acetylase OafA/YrhL